MTWNWELLDWPNFKWDAAKLTRAEAYFLEGVGHLSGSFEHLNLADQKTLYLKLLTDGVMDTSTIEGEYLDRKSVQSSVKRHMGLTHEKGQSTPREEGVTQMMIDLYENIDSPINDKTLKAWHRMLMMGNSTIKEIGIYRTHAEPMQIISGPSYAPKIHFEAPPSSNVKNEMGRFIKWCIDSAPDGSNPLPPITRAAIAHLWFEMIHPFEDGNGRIGRAISEKILLQSLNHPIFIPLSTTILSKQKEYYQTLENNNRGLELTHWILWFATVILEAQQRFKNQLKFTIEKARFLDKARGHINERQEKVLLRMFEEGIDGFKGGLSAKNYATIADTLTATTTRDLQDLVEKGFLLKTGQLKGARYHLPLPDLRITPIEIKDITAIHKTPAQ